jgi:hypothetical protein
MAVLIGRNHPILVQQEYLTGRARLRYKTDDEVAMEFAFNCPTKG